MEIYEPKVNPGDKIDIPFSYHDAQLNGWVRFDRSDDKLIFRGEIAFQSMKRIKMFFLRAVGAFFKSPQHYNDTVDERQNELSSEVER